VVLQTDPAEGITVRLGGQVRVIPTFEDDWDFGLAGLGVPGLRTHVNEAGGVSRNYIRTEDRLSVNVAKGDLWDVFMALEFDSALIQQRTDRVAATRGLFDDFGLERLHASVKLPGLASRFHAGWDVYGVDHDAGGLVYTDDDPGLWVTGGLGPLAWQAGVHFKNEANFVQLFRVGESLALFEPRGGDRKIWSVRLDYTPVKAARAALFWAFNDAEVSGQPPQPFPADFTAHHVGLILTGETMDLKPLFEVVGTWGTVKSPFFPSFTDVEGRPLPSTLDIRAFALFADLAVDARRFTGLPLEPHVGLYYLSGDRNPHDTTLGGFTPIVAMPRVTPRFGGEGTILMDGNQLWGSPLYSLFPEQSWGNQSPLLSTGGGLFGLSRGDNPGMLLIGGGLTWTPLQALTVRTNAYGLWFNESFVVCRVDPADASTGVVPRQVCPPAPGGIATWITQAFFGTAWDTEVAYAVNTNVWLKLQAAALFPGEAVRAITEALARDPMGASRGQASKTATRFAIEVFWSF